MRAALRLVEFMPPRGAAPDIVRIVEGLEGTVGMRSELAVRFDDGRSFLGCGGWMARPSRSPVRMDCCLPDAGRDRTARRSTTISEFVVRDRRCDPLRTHVVSVARPAAGARLIRSVALAETVGATGSIGRGVVVTCGDYHEEIHESLLVLKALTYAPTGGHRRGGDHLASGAHRRVAQLGLPLLLGA